VLPPDLATVRYRRSPDLQSVNALVPLPRASQHRSALSLFTEPSHTAASNRSRTFENQRRQRSSRHSRRGLRLCACWRPIQLSSGLQLSSGQPSLASGRSWNGLFDCSSVLVLRGRSGGASEQEAVAKALHAESAFESAALGGLTGRSATAWKFVATTRSLWQLRGSSVGWSPQVAGSTSGPATVGDR
jgi:hypothetical protein